MGNQRNRKRKSARRIQPIEVVNEAREKSRISMARRRFLAQEDASSNIANEPSTNNPPNEINDYVNAISPNEEVPMVHSPIQFPDVVETPQQRRQECLDIGPSSMPPLEIVRRRTPKCIQVDECALESLEDKLPD